MPLSLTIGNLDKVLAEIKSYPKDTEKIINNEFTVFAVETSNRAKELAPVNEGALRESINFDVGNLFLHVGAYIEYAAYLEFGTKAFAAAYVASLPEDWQAFAAEHKGTGEGTFAELVQAIMKWVQLKGIATGKDINQASYLIARKIVRDGIRAQPFLHPAFEENKLKLIENLKRQLNVK
jgi:HK97 gp10 family phage protein